MKNVSVLLPTIERCSAIDEISEQLQENDELLVICDTEGDPVAQHRGKLPEKAKLVLAGEPDGCSGKANAIHTGMGEAGNERIVWTDDDFNRPDGWLRTLREECDEHGAVSELPFMVGKNPLTVINEPTYALVMVVTYLNNQVWGGSLIFDRERLRDEEEFLERLSSTIGDDVLLSEYLDAKTVRRTRRVEIDSDVREALERLTRFTKNVRYHEPLQALSIGVFSAILAALCIMYPVYGFTGASLAFLAAYLFLGQTRPTFLFAYLSIILVAPFLLYGHLRKTFVWNGRRYRQSGKFDVEIVGKSD